MTPKDMLRIVRKRKWLIAIVWAVATVMVLSGTLAWWYIAPWWTADALLSVEASENVLWSMQRAPMYSKEIMERHKRSQAQLIKDEHVLNKTIEDDRVKRTTWFSENSGDIGDDAVLALAEAININVLPETNFIQISMTSTKRKEVAEIVNTLAEHFIEYTAEKNRQQKDRDIRTLQAQRDDLKSRLDRVRRERAAARGSSPIAAMQERRSILTIKLQMLTQSIAEAEEMQTGAQAALAAYEEDILKGNIENNFEIRRALDMDPTLRQFEMQLYDFRSRLNNAQRTLGDSHRTVKELKNMVENVARQLEMRRKDLVDQNVQVIRQARQMQADIATQQVVALRERYDEARAEARDLEVTLGRIQALAEEARYIGENIRTLEQSILSRRLSLRTSGGEPIGPVSMGRSARKPLRRSHPSLPLMSVVGVLVGALLGFGLAFLLEVADTSIKGPSDLVRRFDLPLLGMVPHSDDLDEEVEDFRRIVLLAPHSPAAEAFRQIRTNLLFSGPAEQRRSLLITSPAPEDGRTTVVLNLAESMAQSGRRVLVVDANFRQPALSDVFPGAPDAGLSSALVGQASWRDVVHETEVPNLSVIAAGPVPPNPAELLGSDAMRQLVKEMSSEYDQVIFDSSPVMVVADACVLSAQVDGTIVVVRAGSNSRGLVQRTSEQLSRVGAHVIGLVLQGVRSTAGGYLRKNYRTFYEYQQKSLP